MKAKHHLVALVVFSLSCMGSSCGESGGGDAFTGSSGQGGTGYDYMGPGSAWSVFLDINGLFAIEEREEIDSPVVMTIRGSFERFDNGFIQLTVSEATGVDAPGAGDQTTAIEAPGFALMLQPFNGDSELIPMVISGACPSADIAGNWAMMMCNSGGVSCDAESDSQEFFGTFSYDADSGAASFPERFSIDDASDLGSEVIGTATCTGGVMRAPDAVLYLSDQPGAVVHTSPDDIDDARQMMALPQEVLIQGDLAGNYVGFAFDKSDDSSTSLFMTISSGGAEGLIASVSPDDLEATDLGSEFAAMSLDAVNEIDGNPADGWITATFTAEGESDRPMYCMAATNLGETEKKLLLCVGQSPTDAEAFYNLVMVSTH